MSKLLTTTEAAKFLNVTPSRVRQFILENRLPAIKIGRDLFIEETDLIEFGSIERVITGRPKKS